MTRRERCEVFFTQPRVQLAVLLSMLFLDKRSWKHHFVWVAAPFAAWADLWRISLDRKSIRTQLDSRRTGLALWSAGAMIIFVTPLIFGGEGFSSPSLFLNCAENMTWAGVLRGCGSAFIPTTICFVSLSLLLIRAQKQGRQFSCKTMGVVSSGQ